MRGALLSLAFMVVVGAAAPQSVSTSPLPTIATNSTSMSYDLQNPGKDINVDTNVNRSSGVWYRNPVWIAIGALALVVLVLIIVLTMLGRGGTTIVRN
jgi:4-hydroxybenzoate polyprenyltransferase